MIISDSFVSAFSSTQFMTVRKKGKIPNESDMINSLYSLLQPKKHLMESSYMNTISKSLFIIYFYIININEE